MICLAPLFVAILRLSQGTGGKQDPVFEGGNRYLMEKFPLLDYIKSARVSRPAPRRGP